MEFSDMKVYSVRLPDEIYKYYQNNTKYAREVLCRAAGYVSADDTDFISLEKLVDDILTKKQISIMTSSSEDLPGEISSTKIAKTEVLKILNGL